MKAHGQLLCPQQVTKFCPYEVRHRGHAGQEVRRGQKRSRGGPLTGLFKQRPVSLSVLSCGRHIAFSLHYESLPQAMTLDLIYLSITDKQAYTESAADFLIGKPRHICLLIIRLIWSSFQLSNFNTISSVKHTLPCLNPGVFKDPQI